MAMWACGGTGFCCRGIEMDQSWCTVKQEGTKSEMVQWKQNTSAHVSTHSHSWMERMVWWLRNLSRCRCAVRLDEALCRDLPVVYPSTCSACPCFSGYESCQTTLFAQAAVTHRVLAGWDLGCRSFLMLQVRCLIDLRFSKVFQRVLFCMLMPSHSDQRQLMLTFSLNRRPSLVLF